MLKKLSVFLYHMTTVHDRTLQTGEVSFGNVANNNNNIYLLHLGCYLVAVVILHVYKT